MKGRFLILCMAVTIGFLACNKAPNGASKIPSITFLSVNPDQVRQGVSDDTAWISFKFEDGDANINTNGQQANIILRDLRNDQILNFSFPPIPEGFKDPVKGMKGTCVVGISGAILQLRDTIGGRTKDTVAYEIYILDEDNQKSNIVTTSPIYMEKI
jgi:hypothetical protein